MRAGAQSTPGPRTTSRLRNALPSRVLATAPDIPLRCILQTSTLARKHASARAYADTQHLRITKTTRMRKAPDTIDMCNTRNARNMHTTCATHAARGIPFRNASDSARSVSPPRRAQRGPSRSPGVAGLKKQGYGHNALVSRRGGGRMRARRQNGHEDASPTHPLCELTLNTVRPTHRRVQADEVPKGLTNNVETTANVGYTIQEWLEPNRTTTTWIRMFAKSLLL